MSLQDLEVVSQARDDSLHASHLGRSREGGAAGLRVSLDLKLGLPAAGDSGNLAAPSPPVFLPILSYMCALLPTKLRKHMEEGVG